VFLRLVRLRERTCEHQISPLSPSLFSPLEERSDRKGPRAPEAKPGAETREPNSPIYLRMLSCGADMPS